MREGNGENIKGRHGRGTKEMSRKSTSPVFRMLWSSMRGEAGLFSQWVGPREYFF